MVTGKTIIPRARHRWYGVDYACNASVPGATTPGGLCHAPCHAVLGCGHQLDYQQAQGLLNSNVSMTGQNYNHTTASVFFDYLCPPSNVTATGYKCNGPGRHQVRLISMSSLAPSCLLSVRRTVG